MTYTFYDRPRQKSAFEKYLSLTIILLFLTLVIFITLFTKTGTAAPEYKCYKKLVSVKIEQGDSLWSIATEYYSPECGDLNSYIDEIKDTNNLDSDTIHFGSYILVPYYLYADTLE